MLRAGLGFLNAAQELLPDADVGFIGISRDEETFQPKPYVNKLPESLADRPMHRARPDARHRRLARRTRASCCSSAAPPARSSWSARSPRRRASSSLRDERPRPGVYTASIDEQLNEHAFIVPGLGDAGDRQFGAASTSSARPAASPVPGRDPLRAWTVRETGGVAMRREARAVRSGAGSRSIASP